MTDIPLEIHEYGDPQNTTLVLLHGGAGLHHLWQPQLAMLSEQYHLLAPDLLYDNMAEMTIVKLAADVAEIIRQKTDGQVYVVGVSFGALVATQVAINHSSLVKGLVISGGRMIGAWRDKFNLVVTAFMGEKAIINTLADTVKEMDETLADSAYEDMKKLGKPGFRAYIKATSQVDFQRYLAKIKMPTMILVGSRDYPHLQQDAESLYEGIEDSELHVIDDVGHHWNLEDPALFNQLLMDFVTRVEQDEF